MTCLYVGCGVQQRAIVLPLLAGDRQLDRIKVLGTSPRVSLHVARFARTCDAEATGGVLILLRRTKRNSRVVIFALSGFLFYLFQLLNSVGVVVVYHGACCFDACDDSLGQRK